MAVLDRSWYGNSLQDWAIALGVALAAAVVLAAIRHTLARRLADHARTTETRLDDAAAALVRATHALFLLVAALYAGTLFVEIPARATRLVNGVAVTALLLQLALWGNRAVALWLEHYLARKRATDAATATTVAVLGFIARLALWAVVSLVLLDNLGVNITALVASLGIGGIAVALAVQNILGDIFASLSIALDKPFVIGDFIVVGDVLGTVEHIGLKTTRLRSLSGEQIVFSNAELLKSRIRNFKRMIERRVQFGFGVVYQTEPDTLARIPQMVREIVEAQPQTRFDRAHFKEYGDSALNFEVVYYLLDPDHRVYMDTQQAINLAILRRFAAEGIAFAYPTRTLYVQASGADEAASAGVA